jgi:hypothetical protein
VAAFGIGAAVCGGMTFPNCVGHHAPPYYPPYPPGPPGPPGPPAPLPPGPSPPAPAPNATQWN